MSRNELTELLLGREVTFKFISIAEAIKLHDESIKKVGGTPGVRDLDLLESALHKPMQQCVYADDNDIYSLSAILADGITQNHAFLDGNKRTAFLSCVQFLGANGVEFSPDVSEAINMFRSLASHEINASELAEWIQKTVEDDQYLEGLREIGNKY
jgi:death on curing protein